MKEFGRFKGTTILSVRRGNRLAMGGDGQVTMGESVVKQKARKIRRLYNDKILAGFAGSTADALSLFSRFEQKLEEFNNKYGKDIEYNANRLIKQYEDERSKHDDPAEQAKNRLDKCEKLVDMDY